MPYSTCDMCILKILFCGSERLSVKMIKKRLIALLLVLCFPTLGLCSPESDFVSAVENLALISSCNVTGEYAGNISAIIPAHIKQSLGFNVDGLLKAVNSFGLKSSSTMLTTSQGLKNKTNFSFVSDDISFSSEVFVEAKDSGLIEAIKIPVIFQAFLPKEYENAEYLVIDISEYSKLIKDTNQTQPFTMGSINFKKSIDTARTSYIKLLKNLSKCFENVPNMISKKGNTFTLTLTDDSLKLLLKSLANDYLSNEETRAATRIFIMDAINIYSGIYPEEILSEIKSKANTFLSMDDFTLSIGKMFIDGYFDILNEIPLLGEKGICINYTLDTRGYISEIEGYADVVIDIGTISAKLGNKDKDEFIINLAFGFNEKYTDINKIKSLDSPVNDKNSVSYINLLKQQLTNNDSAGFGYGQEGFYNYTLPAEDGSISVIAYGNKLSFGGKQPQIIDSALYAPLDELIDYFGYSTTKLHEGAFLITKDSQPHMEPYRILYDDYFTKTIFGNNYEIRLSKEIIDIDGHLYVPVRQFTEAFLKESVTWVEKDNVVYLGYY